MVKYLLFLIPCLLFGQTYTKVDSTMANSTLSTSDYTLGLTGRAYVGTQFTAKGTYTLDRVIIRGEKVTGDNPVMNFTCYIWIDNGSDHPGSVLTSASSSVSATTFPAAGASNWVTPFDFTTGLSITSGTKYWIVVVADAAAADYCYWNYTIGHPGQTRYDADGVGAWSASLATALQARIYQMDITDTGQDKGFKEHIKKLKRIERIH